jgi:hypothetical protein
MWEDPVVEAVRKVREAHAAQFDYDLQAIYRALKEEEAQSGHKFVRLPQKHAEVDSAPHPRSEPSAV